LPQSGRQAYCASIDRRATRSHAISAAVDWKFAPNWDLYAGFMFSQVNSGLANNFFQRNNIDPTVGLRFRF
jgi:hypothetical protein